ncbi:MAG TPA: hypothetical protein ENJ87_05695 [Gammaproteobacteria bacterium]|nr:hypothetical protein [Gammaproteobacteria bacterium]
MKRKQDSQISLVHFQMNRFIHQNGEWFYSTREGNERGPFMTKEDAADDLSAYVYHLNNMEKYGC